MKMPKIFLQAYFVFCKEADKCLVVYMVTNRCCYRMVDSATPAQ